MRVYSAPPTPAFAALLVDLDGHVVGINPGRAFALDDGALAATTLHAFHRLGTSFGHGHADIAFVKSLRAKRSARALIVFVPIAG